MTDFLKKSAGPWMAASASVRARTILGAMALVCGFSTALAFGCGGDDSAPAAADAGGGDDATADATASDSSFVTDARGDALSCGAAGQTCMTGGDCCSAMCDPKMHVCAASVGLCKAPGENCASAVECCSLSCSPNGLCSPTQCTSDGVSCLVNTDCCGGHCQPVNPDGGTAKKCAPLNASCKTAGNTCKGNGDCCSHLCANGFCALQSSFCTQTGDVCGDGSECCSGVCAKASGAGLGTCTLEASPAGGCTIAGDYCGAGAVTDGGVNDGGASDGDANTDGGDAASAEAGAPPCGSTCCSGACGAFGPTGVSVCQPASGCHPAGEVCRSDSDCCGSSSDPGGDGTVSCVKATANDPNGRCGAPGMCLAAGERCALATATCGGPSNCCAGSVAQNPLACQVDVNGVPRCTDVGSCNGAGPGTKAGAPCSSSADCCGLACVPTAADSGTGFVCASACVMGGGACTTNADCCAGIPCVLQPGATGGTCGGGSGGGDAGACALYGQSCSGASSCCNGVPCTNGRCEPPAQ